MRHFILQLLYICGISIFIEQKVIKMKQIIKKVLATSCIVCCAASASASDFNLAFKGSIDTKLGFGKGKKNFSAYKNKFALDSNAGFLVDASKQEENFKYGARLSLCTTAKKAGSSVVNGSHLYIESNYGRIELGSPQASSTMMGISGCDAVAAKGEGWAPYANASFGENPEDAIIKDPVGSEGFADSSSGGLVEASRKISYYTPELYGFQLGLSYIPDTANIGEIGKDKSQSGTRKITYKGTEYNMNEASTDAFTVGLSYKKNISDGFDVEVAGTLESGKAVQAAVDKDKKAIKEMPKEKLMHNLFAYTIGGKVKYGSLTYAASYGNWGKSYLSKFDKDLKKPYYWTAGMCYEIGSAAVSVNVAQSFNEYRNKFEYINLGSSYKWTKGLKSYAEFAFYKGKKKADKTKTLSGTSGLVGMKLSF